MKKHCPTWREIAEVAGEAYGVPLMAVNGHRQHPSAARARDVAIYCAVVVFGFERREVKRKIARMNPSITGSIERAEAWIDKDRAFADLVIEICDRIEERAEARERGNGAAGSRQPKREERVA